MTDTQRKSIVADSKNKRKLEDTNVDEMQQDDNISAQEPLPKKLKLESGDGARAKVTDTSDLTDDEAKKEKKFSRRKADPHFYFKIKDPAIRKKVKKRRGYIKYNRAKAEGEPDYVDTLRDLHKHGEAALADDDYPKGKKKGNVYNFQLNNVPLGMRIDKVNGKVNPRVGLLNKDGGVNDAKTTDIGSSLNDIKTEHHEHFLAGFRGEGADVERKGKELAAYKKGTEAQAVALTSDLFHHPGNSALSERVIKATTSKEKFEQLFLGSGKEKNFGALISQSSYGYGESAQDNNKLYGQLSQFGRRGYSGINGNTGSVRTLKKFASIADADPDLMNIYHSPAGKKGIGSEVDLPTYRGHIEKVDMDVRAAKSQKALEEHNVVESEGEEDEGRERGRLQHHSSAELETRKANLQNKIDILTRKMKAVDNELKQRKEEGEARSAKTTGRNKKGSSKENDTRYDDGDRESEEEG